MEIDAFVLIGGRSTRFGADKAFAEIDGEGFALRSARIVRAAIPAAVVRFVAASESQFGAKTAELGGETVYDIRPGHGAWSSIHAALANSSAEWTLVLACDLPFVTAELLQTLATAASVGVDAVVPRQPDERLQPLCAIYRTGIARDAVESFIRVGGRLPPLQSLFEQLKTAVVDIDSDVLRNVNTPADLA